MTPDARRRQRLLAPSTLVLTLGIAAVIGVTLHFAVTSLPYLALAPTTDPVFGALNGCLLDAVPERVGFAVSPDATSAAAWSPTTLARCSLDGGRATTWSAPGLAVGAFGGDGRLYVSQASSDGGVTGLFVFEGPTPRLLGDVRPLAVVPSAAGVVALEPPGRLLSLSADEVKAVRDVGDLPTAQLASSADGTRVAVVAGGAFLLVDSSTLETVRADAPCRVQQLWWLPKGHRALVSCGPDASWAVTMDMDTGAQETAPAKRREPSTLAGRSGVYVRACDGLPCTAETP
jgi:hypothetical protein